MHPGRRVEGRDDQDLRCRGLVEEVVPHVEVVCIRETGIGEPKMIATQDDRFRGC